MWGGGAGGARENDRGHRFEDSGVAVWLAPDLPGYFAGLLADGRSVLLRYAAALLCGWDEPHAVAIASSKLTVWDGLKRGPGFASSASSACGAFDGEPARAARALAPTPLPPVAPRRHAASRKMPARSL